MTKKAFDKNAAGLTDAIELVEKWIAGSRLQQCLDTKCQTPSDCILYGCAKFPLAKSREHE